MADPKTPNKDPKADPDFWDDLKHQIWEALDQGGEKPPEVQDIFNRPASPTEVYYLLEKWCPFIAFWDIYNLEARGPLVPMTLEGCSPHFSIFDGGPVLVAGPKKLIDPNRTSFDNIQTAKILAGEVKKRGWTVELAGFNKMVRAAWVECQLLGVEVLHYDPTPADKRVLNVQSKTRGLTP